MSGEQGLSPECQMRQEMYAYVYNHPMVQQLIGSYNRKKESGGIMGRTIQDVENRVTDVATRTMPLYEYYVQPSVDAVQSAVCKSVAGTRRVVDVTKNTAITTTTIGIGAAVVISQLIISLGLSGTNWLIDSVIAVRETSNNVVGRIKDSEKVLEDRFKSYVEQVQNLAQVPITKLTDQANIFLDIANRVMDRLLGVESEADPVDCPLGVRLHRMVTRFSNVLQNRAHDNVIDPVANQIDLAMQQLNSYMNLVYFLLVGIVSFKCWMDYVYQRKEWISQRIEGMQNSVNELKVNIEVQAAELMSRPETILMGSVRNTSKAIVDNINTLKERGTEERYKSVKILFQLLGDGVMSRLDNVTTYLQHLQDNLAEVNDIYELRDEVRDHNSVVVNYLDNHVVI
uniref:Perilipin n=1 Tax=Syphacia muris TaxID=451379 RepID=A0A0N5AP95_9BILA